MKETRELDFMTTISIIKAYKKRIVEIDLQARIIWGDHYYEDYDYRCNHISEEREICALMVSYYTEKFNELNCLN